VFNQLQPFGYNQPLANLSVDLGQNLEARAGWKDHQYVIHATSTRITRLLACAGRSSPKGCQRLLPDSGVFGSTRIPREFALDRLL